MSYCEIPIFYSETFPKARKPYACVECSAKIDVGEVHLHFRGKWPGAFDGKFTEGRQHLACREACMFLRDEFQSGECIGFGDLKDHWRDSASPWPDRKRCREHIKKFRDLMARIIWRERKCKP